MIKLVILLTRRKGMTHQEFVNYRRDIHMPLILSIPETKQYIRKFIVSAPTTSYTEPAYDAMVETWFDSVEDLNAFFQSDNFVNKVDSDHINFLDLPTTVSLVTEETVVM